MLKSMEILIMKKKSKSWIEDNKNEEGVCLSTRERRGVYGIKSFVFQVSSENPCAINGKQLPK